MHRAMDLVHQIQVGVAMQSLPSSNPAQQHHTVLAVAPLPTACAITVALVSSQKRVEYLCGTSSALRMSSASAMLNQPCRVMFYRWLMLGSREQACLGVLTAVFWKIWDIISIHDVKSWQIC